MWISVKTYPFLQGYDPSYRTINRFRVHSKVKELIRQCFVQCRCQLVQEKIIDDEAIYKELFENEIISEIQYVK